MARIKWGELGNYLNTKLLHKFDLRGHISQEIVNEISEYMKSNNNPDRLSAPYKEWDEGFFTTKSGHYFLSQSLFNAAYVDPKLDKHRVCVYYKYNGKEYEIRTTEKDALLIDEKKNYIYLTTDGRIKKHGNRFKLNQSADIE